MAEKEEVTTIDIDIDELAIQLGLPAMQQEITELKDENRALNLLLEQALAFNHGLQRTMQALLGEPTTTRRLKANVDLSMNRATVEEEIPSPPTTAPGSGYRFVNDKKNEMAMVVTSK